MKILHICMTQYSDGWTYQENMLAKYHKKEGHDVTVLTSMYCFKEGKLMEDNQYRFVDKNGVTVIRLKKEKKGLLNKIPSYNGFEKTISEIKPNIIFSHGCQYRDVKYLVKYKKLYPDCIIYVDNHADFSNSGKNILSKYVLHRMIWRHYAQLILPYTKQFYGVLPSRVEFLISEYKLPKDKVKLLVMGLDDELAKSIIDDIDIRTEREQLNIKDDDFVIITGGKIDKDKTQTLNLMKVINEMDLNIKLLIFGSIDDDLLEEFNELLSDNIIYLGWLNESKMISKLIMADLAVFPGRHSVIWEQVCGLGIPIVVKDWYGTHHININGNALFLNSDTEDEIRKTILKLMDNNTYNELKRKAESIKSSFYYSEIARRSIE